MAFHEEQIPAPTGLISNGTIAVAKGVGFQSQSVLIDNYTAYWLFIPDANSYIAPFYTGTVKPLRHSKDYVEIQYKSPFATSQNPTDTSYFVYAVWTDAVVAPAPGVASSVSTSGAVSNIVTLDPASIAALCNCIVAGICACIGGGGGGSSLSQWQVASVLPPGLEQQVGVPPTTFGYDYGSVYYRIVGANDPSDWTVTMRPRGWQAYVPPYSNVFGQVYLSILEFARTVPGTTPLLVSSAGVNYPNDGTGSANGPVPTVPTPTGDLSVACAFLNPNYNPTEPAGYTRGYYTVAHGTQRVNPVMAYKIGNATSGLSWSGAGAETCWQSFQSEFSGVNAFVQSTVYAPGPLPSGYDASSYSVKCSFPATPTIGNLLVGFVSSSMNSDPPLFDWLNP